MNWNTANAVLQISVVCGSLHYIERWTSTKARYRGVKYLNKMLETVFKNKSRETNMLLWRRMLHDFRSILWWHHSNLSSGLFCIVFHCIQMHHVIHLLPWETERERERELEERAVDRYSTVFDAFLVTDTCAARCLAIRLAWLFAHTFFLSCSTTYEAKNSCILPLLLHLIGLEPHSMGVILFDRVMIFMTKPAAYR